MTENYNINNLFKKLRCHRGFLRHPNAADIDMMLKSVATCHGSFVVR
jgi:hypothetical protein